MFRGTSSGSEATVVIAWRESCDHRRCMRQDSPQANYSPGYSLHSFSTEPLVWDVHQSRKLEGAIDWMVDNAPSSAGQKAE